MMVKLKDHQSYYNSSCDTRMSAQNTINPIVVEVFHSITRSNMDQVIIVYPLGTMKVCTTFLWQSIKEML